MRRTHFGITKSLPLLELFPLLLKVLDLSDDAPLSGKVGVRRFGRLFLSGFGGLVLWCEVEGAVLSILDDRTLSLAYLPADSIDKLGKCLAVLTRHTFNIALEDEKVLRLDKDVELLELGIVRVPRDRFRVDKVV